MNLPAPFVARTRALLGTEAYAQFQAALTSEAPVTIRVNRTKCNYSVAGISVPWSEQGIYLEKRPTFTFDPHLHAGAYYVQEASSMFVEQALRQYVKEPVVMLDLCAAPGGKSTLARQYLPEGSLLVSNEIMRPRAQVLAENLIKWGHPDVVVTNNEAANFTPLANLFDVILADVPCSGEGMFRKDAVAIEEWSEANVELCWKRQRDILTDIWPTLKPGGLLIYSTCTYNTEENEENVNWIAETLGAEVLPITTNEEWNVTGNLLTGESFPVYRFMPHRTSGEGFFLALLRKNEDDATMQYASAEANDWASSDKKASKKREERERSSKGRNNLPKGKHGAPKGKGNQPKGVVALPSYLSTWLLNSDNYQLQEESGIVTAFPKIHISTYELLKSHLKVIHAGITLGELKGRDYVPHHALAMSLVLNKDTFTTVEVSYTQAIAYLRTESLVLDGEVALGFVLLTYKNIPLGFVKQVGNRANNLYPNEWRIRSSYLPEELLLVSAVSE
ncbi:MAG: methyltransferase RsmF C-terminal domain-like protein [Phocaeicola sp.]